MTITITDPRLEEFLLNGAALQGEDVNAYAEQVLSASARSKTELQEFLDRVASFGKGIPALSDETLTRGYYYEGRD